MSNSISNHQDIIDSRDVIQRFEELTEEHVDLAHRVQEAEANVRHHHDGELDEHGDYPEHAELRECRSALDDWEADNLDELETLRELNRQGEDYAADWRHGETLIRDSYFERYAEELAYDIGAIDGKATYDWPLNCIDWAQAARELQQDYTQIDFDGVTYWVR